MNDEKLYAMRHSLAHITAAAVRRLWPGAKFGVGPVIENGFYYDIDLGRRKISEQNFPKIEKTMRRIIAETRNSRISRCRSTKRSTGRKKTASRTKKSS